MLAILVLSGVMSGCGSPEAAVGVRVQVENRTDTPVGVYIDDTWVGTDEPGATIAAGLEATDADAYRIEARSPSGVVLAAFDAPAAGVQALQEGGGDPLGRIVAVPCGEIVILVGELASGDTLPSTAPAEPGPCR